MLLSNNSENQTIPDNVHNYQELMQKKEASLLKRKMLINANI